MLVKSVKTKRRVNTKSAILTVSALLTLWLTSEVYNVKSENIPINTKVRKFIKDKFSDLNSIPTYSISSTSTQRDHDLQNLKLPPIPFERPNILANKPQTLEEFLQHIKTVRGQAYQENSPTNDIINSFGLQFSDLSKYIPEEILHLKVLDRMKDLDQSSGLGYSWVKYFSRYHHTSHLLFLSLQKFKECGMPDEDIQINLIRMLLHDLTHPFCSHLGDHVFRSIEKEEKFYNDVYQDRDYVFKTFFKRFGIEEVLLKHGLKIEDILPGDCIPLKGNPKPGADHVSYILQTAAEWGIISKEQHKAIIDDIHYDLNAQKWYFSTLETGVFFGDLSIYFTRKFYESAENYGYNEYFTLLLKYIIQQKIEPVLTVDDLKYSSDTEIFEKICNIKDKRLRALIQEHLLKCFFQEKVAKEIVGIKPQRFGTLVINKATGHAETHTDKLQDRSFDPYIKTIDAAGNTSYAKASELDRDFAKRLKATKDYCGHGVVVDIGNISTLEKAIHDIGGVLPTLDILPSTETPTSVIDIKEAGD